jgi:hypothetical protein
MEKTTNHLPLDFQPFTSLLPAQPPEAQEAFQFLPPTALHEGGNPRFGKFGLVRAAGRNDDLGLLEAP